MKILEVAQQYGTQNSVLQPTSALSDSMSTAKSEYEKILAEKIANAKDTMERMNEIQAELDYNKELHKELTGKNPSDNIESEDDNVQTIRKFMPDGSIMVMTVKEGEVVETHRKKPHLIAVADPAAPKTESGHTAVKMQPHFNLLDMLMM